MIKDKIEDLQTLLENLGYQNLTPDGKFWRTNAVYREGDNATALRINRKTGDFVDFVSKQRGSLEDLVKLTNGFDDVKLKSFLKENEVDINALVDREHVPIVRIEKTWDHTELSSLFPHYKFYENKGASKELLKFLRSGLAHSGAMSERYVFPIFNKEGKIHGWSGRDTSNKKSAKWKHMGRKANWIYPAYMPLIEKDVYGKETISYPVIEEIRRKKEVILVESIGDMLSLWENGYKNVLVLFGLYLPNKMASWLMSQGVTRIILALNNDLSSDKNTGKTASIDAFIDACSYFDFQNISICLPIKKDFGEMDCVDYEKWEARKANFEKYRCIIYKEVIARLKQKHKEDELTDDEIVLGKSMKAMYELYTN